MEISVWVTGYECGCSGHLKSATREPLDEEMRLRRSRSIGNTDRTRVGISSSDCYLRPFSEKKAGLRSAFMCNDYRYIILHDWHPILLTLNAGLGNCWCFSYFSSDFEKKNCRNLCFILKSGARAKDLPQSLRNCRKFLWLREKVPNHAFTATADKPSYCSNSVPWSLRTDSSRVSSPQQKTLSSRSNIWFTSTSFIESL
jgi:hypothetical protein